MDVDTLLVTLSHLPRSMRIHINDLVTFANDVDNTVSLVESRLSKQPSISSSANDKSIDDSSPKLVFRNSFHSQDDLSKVVRSLRRLFLCMCDLFDMLENCVEVLDPVKKKSLYLQIEPSVSLIKNTLSDIREHYTERLHKEGIHFSFKEVDSALDAFVSAVREERNRLSDGKPIAHHPNLLIVMTSGLSNKEIEDSISRYIPRSDVFPCDDEAFIHQSFVETSLDDTFIRPASPGIMEWEDNGVYGLDMEGESSPVSIRNSYESANRPSSPSIGQPVHFPNIAHFARNSTVLKHHYNAAGGECPGRATLLTGQLPPIHGVRTSLEKTGERSELKIDEVPTLGHYFAAAGYDVVYKGEWGLSQLQALQEHPILDLLGVERDADEDLQPFGFQGWEAHKEGDWYQRSLQTTSEAIEYLRRRESVITTDSLRGSQPPPWALVVSYPDILPDMRTVQDSDTPDLVTSASTIQINSLYSSENLNKSLSCGNLRRIDSGRNNEVDFSIKKMKLHVKDDDAIPAVQKLYREHCASIQETYLESQYNTNSQKLDSLLGELFQEVLRSGMDDTVIVFTEVAGNLVGDHQMWGCCYNGYEEAIRVPCMMFIPQRLPLAQRLVHGIETQMTSSIDVLPTLLHIAGIDQTEVHDHLHNTLRKVPGLVGHDLCQGKSMNKEEFVYYQNEDVAMPIPQSTSLYCVMNASVNDKSVSVTQRSVTVVIARVTINEKKRLLKLCYYSSDPRSCSHLSLTDQVTCPCEWELFDLEKDPNEIHNLVRDPSKKELLKMMKSIMCGKHNQLCNMNDTKDNEESSKQFSLISWMSPKATKEVKWRQFYTLIIALVVSIVAVLIRFMLS